MDLTQLLISASSQDAHVLQPATQELNVLQERNFPMYVQGLVTNLANAQVPPNARRLAGLLLKNLFSSHEESKMEELAQRWLLVDEATRTGVKSVAVKTLSDPIKEVRSVAALVVGKVAGAEVPKNLWPEVIDGLTANVQNASSPGQRQASLEALGYVCEECSTFLQNKSNLVLNAIAVGMGKDQPDEIKLAATTALANSLDFVKANFEREGDRNTIIRMVYQAAQSTKLEVRVAAFQCLVEIALSYYDFLPEFMKHIFVLTGTAIQNEPEPVALQAIEFWSTICEEERARHEEIEDAMAKQVQPRVKSNDFAKLALPQLTPLILQCLTKQSDVVSDDTWNVAMAAATNLGLLAQTVRDDIVGHVLPFVKANIANQDWHYREAAILAFGFILDGPSKQGLATLVQEALPFILQYTRDASPMVKDTATWTLGRICDLVHNAINDAILPKLMTALSAGLQDEPKIAANVCWSLHNLATHSRVTGQTSPLSGYFEGVLTALIATIDRPDVDQYNLLPCAYEAITEMIRNAAPDCMRLVEQLLATFSGRLKKTLAMPVGTPDQREWQNTVQSHICGVLQCIIEKLEPAVTQQHADGLMFMFLQVLSAKSGTVHEEALMAIGAVANQIGPNFEKYMGHFKKFITFALGNFKEYHVCTVAVGVVGDLARALEKNIAKYCDEIMQLLLQDLQNPMMERSVKPHIISCIGDIALAIGGYFERYLPYVMMMLVQASATHFEELDYENQEYLNDLRDSILSGYTGIVQGLTADNKVNLFQQFLPQVLGFMELIANDQAREDSVLRGAVGLVGDLVQRMGPAVKPLVHHQAVKRLLHQASLSRNPSTQQTAQWATGLIKQVV